MQSKCWTCTNAYAHRCLWVRCGIEIWESAPKNICKDCNGNDMEVAKVQVCAHYNKEVSNVPKRRRVRRRNA